MKNNIDTDDFLLVSDLGNIIKSLFNKHLSLAVRVKGEILNPKKNSGNLYFTLKDENANISCVYWGCSGDYISGDEVVVSGKAVLYSKTMYCQISVSKMEKVGLGELNAKYEKDKKEFELKGYYQKKRNLPTQITNIGIITSKEGAALQDILYVLKNNNFFGNIFIKNCSVQGKNCPSSVSTAIKYFNKKKNVDLLVIARGGGSKEDLMGYSNEEVVKAIYNSEIPTISAIGHEIDFMLSDFACDYRAPTPSISASVIVEIQKKELNKIEENKVFLKELDNNIRYRIQSYEKELENILKKCDKKNIKHIFDKKINDLENIKLKIKDKINFNIRELTFDLDKIKINNKTNDVRKNMENGCVYLLNKDGEIVNKRKDFLANKKKGLQMKLIFLDGEEIIL